MLTQLRSRCLDNRGPLTICTWCCKKKYIHVQMNSSSNCRTQLPILGQAESLLSARIMEGGGLFSRRTADVQIALGTNPWLPSLLTDVRSIFKAILLKTHNNKHIRLSVTKQKIMFWKLQKTPTDSSTGLELIMC